MKKQFFRVKQLADQTFSRAGKTEVLSDELQDAEKRVEFIKAACNSAGKKLGTLTNAGHDAASREKRLKKNSEYCFGLSLVELAAGNDDQLLRSTLTECGKLEMCLATTIVDYEMKVESNVLTPLLNICENEYPNIMKLKRNLAKLILDMDSARTRYQTALKHGGSTGGSKADQIKDELEEAESKVEQCRDALACEMLHLIAREAEFSSVILEYARLQRNYHTAAQAAIDKIIPDMEKAINESSYKPVFGTPLEEHLRVSGRKIAYPIELCVCGLLELGIAEEGLFRVAPGASKLRRMKLSFDAHCLDLDSALQFRDPHVFAGTLKSYLRELPEPLLTHDLYDQWMAAARVSSNNQKEGLTALWSVLQNLPQANFDNLQYLVKFLASLSSKRQSNKMTPQNIAIVISPNLIWSPIEDPNNIGLNMNTASLHSVIVDSLISYCDWFFPGDIDFYVTLTRDVSLVNGHGGEHSSDTLSVSMSQDMKRAHSNDSLSDHNSPPQGSPKPAMRARKQKSTAPHPPSIPHKDKDPEDKAGKEGKQLEKEKPVQKEHHSEERHNIKEEPPKPSSNKEDMKPSSIKEDTKPSIPTEEPKSLHKEHHHPKPPREDLKKLSLKEEPKPPPVIEAKPSHIEEPKPKMEEGKSPMKSEIIEIKETLPEGDDDDDVVISSNHSSPPDVREESECKIGELDRRASKSREDLRKPKPIDMYQSLERRKPPRPAPRTTILEISSEKPAIPERPVIPERPATLQRPQSFKRTKLPLSTEPHPTEVDGRTLERAHHYLLADKQQVSYVQCPSEKVPNEKKNERERRESGEKPEKPKKPDSLIAMPGHQRAASEGSIIDTGLSVADLCRSSRPPRPTPPPPPTVSPAKKESTNL